MSDTAPLPRWDVTDVHESLDGRSFAMAHETYQADLTRLTALYDRHNVGPQHPHPPTSTELSAFDEVIAATNELMESAQQIDAYVTAFVSTNSYDGQAQGVASQLRQLDAGFRQLYARLAAWVGALGAQPLVAGSSVAADHAWPLARLEVRASHQMSGPEEELHALLTVTGSSAWARLQDDLVSQLKATVEREGRGSALPMPAVRAMASSSDANVRRAAYDAEMATWPAVALPLASAINSIKGEANEVNRRRGWADPLDASIYANGIDRVTFDAMTDALVDSLPTFRRYLRAKASLLGHDGALPWWDLVAPAPLGRSEMSWEHGCRIVKDAFGAYSPHLLGLAERAMNERWIDVEARDGKRGGAFCVPFVHDRSLVLLNWSGSADGVQTLAHELGHAYHNVQLAPRTPLQRQTAMATAETASIFCETLVVEAGLAHSSGDDRLALLDVDLVGSTQVIVDIWSRFRFETELFRRRRERTLTADELCELMLAAQTEAYGDGLDEAHRHPWMWAVKPHYYFSHYYNWPYAFGLLFGLGLYARYQQDPERFRDGYDDLLSLVGTTPTVELATRFGLDIRDRAFWQSSFDTIAGRVDEYERLAASLPR